MSLREYDVFMTAWLTEKVTIVRLSEDRPALSDLADDCRADAWAAQVNPTLIEKSLGATIEEAIVVVVNVLRDGRWQWAQR